jgi:hypothetical protein
LSGIVETGLGALLTASDTFGHAYHTRPSVGYAIGGSFTALFAGMALIGILNDTPEERLLRLYHQDPAVSVHFDVAATSTGPVAGVSGRF